MPFVLWLLAGLFGGGMAGLTALLVHLRRTKITYPAPETLVTEPDVDLRLTRDGNSTFHLHRHSDDPQRIYAGDVLLWEASPDRPAPPETFTLSEPLPPRPVLTLEWDGGRRLHVAEREIPLEGVANFRDIGGYRTRDGQHVRWNRVYRSGSLAGLTTSDQRLLHTLGVRIVCDLRSTEEVEKAPDNLHEYGGIDYRHMEVLADRDASQRERLQAVLFQRERLSQIMPEIYTRVGLEHNAKLNGEILRLMADPDNLPLVVHCTAGKDRTGVIIALLLLLLDVPEETIIADYSLSNHHFATFREIGAAAVKPLGVLGIGAADIQPLLVADPASMRYTLDYIRKHYGSAKAYLNDRAGVDSDTIEALRSVMLTESV